MDVAIREERPTDLLAVHCLNAAAFPTDAEARLVDALRAHGRLTLSLVAEDRGVVVGHIAFSPVSVLEPGGRIVPGIGLAPMAVRPEHQRSGIGGRLVEAGLDRLRADGHAFCVVLGHPGYYPRFGFEPASRFGLHWENEAPDEAFLAQELAAGGLAGVHGVVRYAPEFEEV
jgi:putative acetyltransferase